MPIDYKFLTPEQRQHFLEHGWLRIPNSIPPELLDGWMDDIWARLGWDPTDKSTWAEEVVWMPRHRERVTKEVCPDAWQAMVELVGGEERINMERESAWVGDQFIVNVGTEYWEDHDVHDPIKVAGWHIDGDWYKHFLDSGENGLVIIQCFTDILPRGGGTNVCEDGIPGLCKFLYNHPEGTSNTQDTGMYDHLPSCTKFVQFEAKKGDTILMHALLPHAVGKNHIRALRVVTNPHIGLNAPFNLNRPDPSDYSLVEQVVLRALGRDSLPEWKITAPRQHYYPRNYIAKFARVNGELERMIAHAEKKGHPKDSVDSVYLRGEEEIELHKKRNGLTQLEVEEGIQ